MENFCRLWKNKSVFWMQHLLQMPDINRILPKIDRRTFWQVKMEFIYKLSEKIGNNNDNK